MTDRLNPKSILVCNIAFSGCGKEVLNDPKSLMKHFITEHDWRKIPELVQKDIDNHKPHPMTHEIFTEESYLKFVDDNPRIWWLDNQFIWSDIRNLHFLHKTSEGLRSLRNYFHDI
jgi:hypothetical protein